MIATRLRNTVLYLLGGLLVYILLTIIGQHVAHGATDTAPPPAPGWSMAEVMALIALIVASVHAVVEGARAFLHFTAPRTKTTLDDRAAAALDAVHQRLAAIEVLIPRTAQSAPASPPNGIIGPIAVALLCAGSLLAMQPGCATVKAAPGAAAHAAIDCAKADAGPILQLAAALGAQALLAAIDQGSIDWPAIEEAAATQGKIIGGCALTKFVANLERAPRSDTTARSLLAPPDPAADGRAALARLSKRFDGAVWQ